MTADCRLQIHGLSIGECRLDLAIDDLIRQSTINPITNHQSNRHSAIANPLIGNLRSAIAN
jgi:hypothetical protein